MKKCLQWKICSRQQLKTYKKLKHKSTDVSIDLTICQPAIWNQIAQGWSFLTYKHHKRVFSQDITENLDSAYLTRPIATETNHSLQPSLTILKNFPRNWIISICQRREQLYNHGQRWYQWRESISSVTWNTVVIPIIPMNRWFFVTPLKTFFSSGFRALNSLKIWHKKHTQVNSNLRSRSTWS